MPEIKVIPILLLKGPGSSIELGLLSKGKLPSDLNSLISPELCRTFIHT